MVWFVLCQLACAFPFWPQPTDSAVDSSSDSPTDTQIDDCSDDWASKAEFREAYEEALCRWYATCPDVLENEFEQCMEDAWAQWDSDERCLDSCAATECLARLDEPCTAENKYSQCTSADPFTVCDGSE